MRPGLTTLWLLIGTLALGACGGDETTTADAAPDQRVEADATPEIDWGVPQDLGAADTAPPDLAQPDGPRGDGLAGDTGANPDVTTAGIDRCVGAQQITLSGGQATVQGDTSTLSDEYATLKCQATGASSSIAMDGPQAYYKLDATKDQWYRFELKPQFGAYLYIFTSTTCGEVEIATDCTSGGASGEMMTYVGSGNTGVAHFKAPADGVLRFAVDSAAPTTNGAFELAIAEVTPPQNATCAQAEQLTLVGGKASVTGYTGATLTPDEAIVVTCGSTSAFDGPQVYYQFDAQAGQAYDLALTATASSGIYLYVFGSSCAEADVEADCASGGGAGAVLGSSVSSGSTRNMTFIPDTTGSYTIAVDSKAGSSSGGFRLEIAEFTPPSNGVCAGAQEIVLSGGHGVVSASTNGVLDEFATLACKGTGQTSTTTMDGPQLYYKFAAQKDQWYRVTLDPSFTAYAYVFTKTTCAAAAIQADCQSQGLSGEASSSVSSRKPEAIYFKAPATADVFVAVDSTSPTTAGDFTLTIDALPTAQNGTCSNAAALTLTGGKTTVQGDTAPGLTPDQFASLQCKGTGSTIATTLDGPQAYYKFAGKAGQWYRITLTPTFTAYMYAFTQAACTAAAIGVDCQSQGVTGEASGSVSSWIPELMHFQAASAGDVYVAVDSTLDSYFGTFFLDVEEIVAPANDVCANAEPLSFAGGSASATGEVGPLLTPDQYATLKCGKTTAFDGPQVYYRFAATVNKTYEITLTAETASSLYLYVFGASCAEADIETDCASGGTSGDVFSLSVSRGSSRTLSFIAPATGTFHIGVDKTSDADYGTFRITVQEK